MHTTPSASEAAVPFRDGARRRQSILAAARRLFLEHGYHATTTRQIARAGGVSDALVYRYFPSKRDLFDAVIEEGLDYLRPYLQFGAPALEGLKLRETLEAAAYTTVEIIRRNREVFQLIVAENRLLEGDRRVTGVIDNLQEHFAARIDAFIDAGEIRRCNTRVFVRQFIGGVAMYDLYTAIFEGAEIPDADTATYVTEVVDAAVRALRPGEDHGVE